MRMRRLFRSLCSFCLVVVLLGCFWVPPVSAEEAVAETSGQVEKVYDGLWFCGFNFRKDLFSGKNGTLVRQAFNHAIHRADIVKKIVGDDLVPTGVLPPGLAGEGAALSGYGYDVKQAKALMQQAGYGMTDPALKQLVLLHTDGDKTVKIAQRIQNDLRSIGVLVTRKQVSYADPDVWENELLAGRYHLFLMGYKAEDSNDALSLLYPLFSKDGTANVSGFQNDRVDFLLFQAETTTDTLQRNQKIQAVNQILFEDPATINLFYITKLPDLPEELVNDLSVDP